MKLPFDELNAFGDGLELSQYRKDDGSTAFTKDAEDIIDELLDLYLLSIENAVDEANEALDGNYEMDEEDIEEIVFKRIDGLNFEDRVNEYVALGDAESIKRVADTDTHRIYETASYMASVANGATKKTWHTMEDDRVRDSHWMLDGVTIPIDSFFASGEALSDRPGNFGIAEEDCNCRCYLSYSK